jgi:hypothetical protein
MGEHDNSGVSSDEPVESGALEDADELDEQPGEDDHEDGLGEQ